MTNDEIEQLLTQAAISNTKENFANAEHLCRKALSISDGAPVNEDEEHLSKLLTMPAELQNAVALRLLSESLWRRGMASRSLAFAKSGLAIALDLDNQPEIALSLSNVGIVYEHLSDSVAALEFFTKALAVQEKLGDSEGIASNHGYIGVAYKAIAEYPLALEHMHKELAFYEESGNQNNIAASFHNIGSVYLDLMDYPRALEYYGKALAMNENNGNNVWMSNNLSSIGKIYIDLEDYPQALEYYHKSLSLVEEIGVKDAVANMLSNIGIVYSRMLDYPKAIEYLQNALAISEEMGFKVHIVRCYINIGYFYKGAGEYSSALQYMTLAMDLAEDLGLKELAANNLGNIGELYAEKGFDGYNPEKAEEYLLRAIDYYKDDSQKQNQCDFYKSLANVYRHENKWEEADTCFQKYHEIYVEIRSDDTKNVIQNFGYERKVAERDKEIAIAKAAADARMNATTGLLHKVLPPSIASRLIKGEKIADYFSQISILFADIVGFTPIASKMPARKVLAFLNYVFGEFDRICESHGCEKIKTIGDGYMAVAGAPIECSDHAERITRAALEMMGDIQLPEDIRSSLPKGAIFNIRIGINSGPAFGGIVGENRFVYDIYSDSVNTAARMESHGEPGKIHVSEEFLKELFMERKERLMVNGEWLMEEADNVSALTTNNSPLTINHSPLTINNLPLTIIPRGEMEIKGKGTMQTYFLEKNG
jgi:adenylate cyclase